MTDTARKSNKLWTITLRQRRGNLFQERSLSVSVSHGKHLVKGNENLSPIIWWSGGEGAQKYEISWLACFSNFCAI